MEMLSQRKDVNNNVRNNHGETPIHLAETCYVRDRLSYSSLENTDEILNVLVSHDDIDIELLTRSGLQLKEHHEV